MADKKRDTVETDPASTLFVPAEAIVEPAELILDEAPVSPLEPAEEPAPAAPFVADEDSGLRRKTRSLMASAARGAVTPPLRKAKSIVPPKASASEKKIIQTPQALEKENPMATQFNDTRSNLNVVISDVQEKAKAAVTEAQGRAVAAIAGAQDRAKSAMVDVQDKAKVAYAKGSDVATTATEMVKGNAVAIVASGKTLRDGLKDIGEDNIADGRKAIETVADDMKDFAVLTSASDLLRLQGRIAGRNFDAVKAYAVKNGGGLRALLAKATEPLAYRVRANLDTIRNVA